MGMDQIKILIVDDHPLMRDAVRAAVEDEEDMVVIGEAENGAQALEQVKALLPDVIILDLYMPLKDGLSTIAEITESYPDVHILTLTSASEQDKILAAVHAGAQGYVTKDIKRSDLLQAIRTVSQGESYLPPHVAAKLLHGLRRQPSTTSQSDQGEGEPLTGREKEVLEMVGRGLSNSQIAEELFISVGTVRTHIHHLLQKLGLENRGQLIVYALRQGKGL